MDVSSVNPQQPSFRATPAESMQSASAPTSDNFSPCGAESHIGESAAPELVHWTGEPHPHSPLTGLVSTGLVCARLPIGASTSPPNWTGGRAQTGVFSVIRSFVHGAAYRGAIQRGNRIPQEEGHGRRRVCHVSQRLGLFRSMQTRSTPVLTGLGRSETWHGQRHSNTVAAEGLLILETKGDPVTRGNSPRITAGPANRALVTADDLDHYVRSTKVVDIELVRIAKEVRATAEDMDIADFTVGVMLSGLRESGVMGERFWRMMQELRRHVEERDAA